MPGQQARQGFAGDELAVAARRLPLGRHDLDRRRRDRRLSPQRSGCATTTSRGRISSTEGVAGSSGVPAADAARDARAIRRK